MKRISVARQGLAFFGVNILGLGLLASGMVYAASTDDGTAAEVTRFVQLDAAAERLLDEVTALGTQMAILEEARELSSPTRLQVLVTVDPGSLLQLETVQLHIDERMVSFHQYTETELTALQQGGSHRLFWDNVSAGRHQLTVSVMGRVPKNPDFQRKSTLVMTPGEGHRMVELQVVPGKDQPLPEMLLKEWK